MQINFSMKKDLSIKVCGMKYKDNIKDLLRLNPDFIGFIFYPKSTRYIGCKIPELDYKSTRKTGVFVNESIENVMEIANNNTLSFIQLHGYESPDYCKLLKDKGFQLIKAFSVDEHFDFEICKSYEKVCDLFLFDTKGTLPGGNGKRFNWKKLEEYTLEKAFLLSGGISLKQVDEIKHFKHPYLYGIDVNSGFEIEPALKNIKELELFFKILGF